MLMKGEAMSMKAFILLANLLLTKGAPEPPSGMQLIACSESENVDTVSCSYKSLEPLSYRECGHCPPDSREALFIRKGVVHTGSIIAKGDCYVRCEYVKLGVNPAQCASGLCDPRHAGLPLSDCTSNLTELSCVYAGVTPRGFVPCSDMKRNTTLIETISSERGFFLQQKCTYKLEYNP